MQKKIISKIVKPTINQIAKYIPGESLINGKENVIKLSSNESPFNVPSSVSSLSKKLVSKFNLYPDGDSNILKNSLSKNIKIHIFPYFNDARSLRDSRFLYNPFIEIEDFFDKNAEKNNDEMTEEELNAFITRVEDAIEYNLTLEKKELTLLFEAFKACLHLQERASHNDLTIKKLNYIQKISMKIIIQTLKKKHFANIYKK